MSDGSSGRRRRRNVLAPATAGLLLTVLGLTSGYGEVRNSTGVAVIIGNRSYDHERVPEVSYAHRDAAAFKRYVIDVLGYDEANIIELLDASQAELETTLGNERSHEGTLWRYLHPRGSDVVVYYSGHGVPGLNDRRGYLLPRNAHPDTAEINGYPIDVLYENLGKLADARSVTVYLDACFSGDSHEGMLVRSASPVTVPAELPGAAAEKLTVLTAASGTQLASWDEQAEHGLFTQHLLDALYGKGDQDGDERVTAGEVVEYLLQNMTRAARRVYGRHQHATLNGLPGVVLANALGGVFPVRPVLDADGAVSKRAPAPPTAAPASRDQVQRDLLLLGMKEANQAGNHERVLEYGAKLMELGGELPLEGKYYQAQAYVHAGSNEEAIEELTAYLEETGREGEHYQAALQLLLRLNERLGEEDAAYERAKGRGTAAGYGEYLREYPNGRYVAEARRQQEAAERREDDAAFGRARSAGTAAAYGEYLSRYASGRHSAEARRQRGDAQKREDDAAYERARRSDTAAAYAEYLRKYPAGRHAAEARRLREEKDLSKFKDCEACPELVVVPAGSFMMGSPGSEEGRDYAEGPVHRVTIGVPFAVGVYEVTRGEFEKFIADTGYDTGDSCWIYDGEYGEWKEVAGKGWRDPGYWQTERAPVVCVNWHDAQAYVRWLSGETGEEYRLLSESEWEYVARGRTRTARYWGESWSGQCRHANGADRQSGFSWAASCDDGYAETAPVGSYTRNEYGLYDVLGNVWEWVEDCWNGSYGGAPSDGGAWEGGDCARRVLRGGSWNGRPRDLRSAARDGFGSGLRGGNLGFRVARTLTS